MKRSDSLDRTIFSIAHVCPGCGLEQSTKPDLICPRDGALLVTGMQSGAVFDHRYKCLSTLGHGGMGLVVKALDQKNETVVALKLLLRSDNRVEAERLRQEFRVAQMLQHPNIVALHQFGTTEDNCAYVVMEYLDGDDLASVLSKKGVLDAEDAYKIFEQLCSAMSFAHQKGVLHRDLKPSNIMVLRESGDMRIKLVDFGIAKIIPAEGVKAENLTQTGQILGSPLYMSPEQALGKKVDGRSDIYSAACVLYHMLTGAPPIGGSTSIETLFQHVHATPLRLSEASLGKKFPKELEDVVAKALSKDPELRPVSFDQFNSEIKSSSQNDNTSHVSNSTIAKHSEFASHTGRKKFAIAGVVLLATSVAGILSFGILNRGVHDEPVQDKSHQSSQPPQRVREATTAGAADQKAGSSNQAQMYEGSNILDSDLTADAFARRQIEGLVKQKSKYVDYQNNDKMVTNKTIEILVAALKRSTKRLRSLDLKETAINDEGIKMLIALNTSDLTNLSVAHTKVSQAGLSMIGTMEHLESLDLRGLRGLTDHSLDSLGKLKSLKSLDVSFCYPHGTHAISTSFLRKLKSLKTFIAESNANAINDSCASDISTLSNLRNLDLNWTAFGDEGLRNLKNIGSLQSLELCGKNLTDNAISSLGGAFNLKSLSLRRQPITTAGVSKFLSLYDQNKIDLSNLDLSECSQIDETSCRKLRTGMPHCEVNCGFH